MNPSNCADELLIRTETNSFWVARVQKLGVSFRLLGSRQRVSGCFWLPI